MHGTACQPWRTRRMFLLIGEAFPVVSKACCVIKKDVSTICHLVRINRCEVRAFKMGIAKIRAFKVASSHPSAM